MPGIVRSLEYVKEYSWKVSAVALEEDQQSSEAAVFPVFDGLDVGENVSVAWNGL